MSIRIDVNRVWRIRCSCGWIGEHNAKNGAMMLARDHRLVAHGNAGRLYRSFKLVYSDGSQELPTPAETGKEI